MKKIFFGFLGNSKFFLLSRRRRISLLFCAGLTLGLFLSFWNGYDLSAFANNSNLSPSRDSHLVNPVTVNNNSRFSFERTSLGLKKREFPVGIYDRIDKPEHLAQIKEMGFNLVMPYTHPYAKGNFSLIQNYLDTANNLGIKVILEPLRSKIKQRDFASIQHFVRTFKNHPALYAWYSYDEPVFNKIPPQLLERVYRVIKTEDNLHPVILDFSGPRSHNLSLYRNSFDICKVNQYPFKHKVKAKEAFDTFQAEVGNVARLARDEPFWLVIQSFADKKWRLPSPVEQKYMLYSGLFNGADGIFFYGYHRAPKPWQNSVVKPLVKDFQNYLPAIQSGSRDDLVKHSARGLQVKVYQDPATQENIIIAINHREHNLESQIQLANELPISSIKVSEKNKTFEIKDNGFTDIFKPHEVSIYRAL